MRKRRKGRAAVKIRLCPTGAIHIANGSKLLYECRDFRNILGYIAPESQIENRLHRRQGICRCLKKVDVKDSCHAQFIKVTFEESCLCLPPPEASMLLTHLEPNTLLPNLFADAYTHREDETYLTLVLNALVLRLTRDGTALKNHITAPGNPLAAKALRRINEQFPAAMSLQQLARELCVTPEHLSRVFKAYIGMGFCQYTNAFKLCHAATLLCETSATVTEIGYACGYENLSHFLRCFKEKYGTTPKHYRAQQAAVSKHGCPIGGHWK